MRMKRRSLLLILLVVLILGLNVGQAYGQGVKELKSKQDSIKEKINDTKSSINEIKKQSNDVSKELDELDKKLNTASYELEKVEKELSSIEKSIEKNEKELEEAEENLKEREELFGSRLKVMYMNGNMGYLELLLTSESIKDFFARKEMIQSIAEHDNELIEFMKEQKEIIETKKMELKAQRASVEVSRNKIKARKDDLASATREKELLMSRLESDATELEKSQKQLEADSKAIGNQIYKIQQEEERKRQEAAKKAQANQGNSNNSGSSAGTNSPYTGGRMAWPVPGHSRISSPYGYRIHPTTGRRSLHTGIDIPAPTGTPIRAASPGRVIVSGPNGSYGNTIVIDHGGGLSTLYSHNSVLVVGVGTSVNTGDIIAKAGSTGRSTGPHCHFEVRQNGSPVNPMPWLR